MTGQESSSNATIGTGQREPRWRAAAVCLVLAAMTFVVFGQTLRHEFIDFDDRAYVYENPLVAQGLTLKGIVWAFTHFHSANWHPLTWLSHMLDCQLYGLHPAGHHLSNILLHIATVSALFLVLRQMTGAFWRSAFVAAVFAIHPLRVESVAWVAERKDVLSGLFFMLTIGAYVRYARRAWSWRNYGLVMFLFAMGLMCKPMLVTLPVVLLLLDYWPLRRVASPGRLVAEKLPLLALSATSCVLTLSAQNEAMSSTASISLPLRFANALATTMIYPGQMVWPAGLAVYYPFPHNGLPPWGVALAGMLLAGISAVAWAQRRKQPWLLMGWAWYLVLLLPVAGIIQVGGQAHADRYTYLPQIGIYVAVTWLAANLRASRMIFGSLMAGVLAVLMACAWKQTAYWQDSETLWRHTLACTTSNDVAHNNLGDVLFQKGRVDEAIAHFQQTLQINPNFKGTHYNLATALMERGRVDEAITQYREALRINPGQADAHVNLGNALRQLGSMDEAMAEYQKALQINPDSLAAHNNLGIVLSQKGRTDEAIAQFQWALQIKPDDAQARYNLGLAFFQNGRMDDAISQFQKALQFKPDYLDARVSMGIALSQDGRVAEAMIQYQLALQLQPVNPTVQNNLAWLLATGAEASLRSGNKAVELASQANHLSGGENPIILRTLAAGYAEAGRFSEAVETAQHALRLAEEQSRTGLAGQLRSETKLYGAGSPLHIPAPTH
ncbi:MAG: tetratricopeptide repeat protein [Verrucomicrobiota bacterium]|jgi:tetratricopeptide (TPR) repeat protein